MSIETSLRNLSETPKAAFELRRERRMKVHAEWRSLEPTRQPDIMRDLISYTQQGRLSPNADAAAAARSNNFKKGVGPAVNWLSSVLDGADNAERNRLYTKLTAAQQTTAEAIRCRKPWGGVIDPLSKPLVPQLKNYPAIGRFSPADNGKSLTVKTIGIVGNGLTGQLIGVLLNQVGKDTAVHFYESEKTIGGRMFTHTTAGGTHFEGGAMRLPRSGKNIHHFLKQIGIGKPGEETVPFPNMGEVPGKLLSEGVVINWDIGETAPNDPHLKRLVDTFEAFCNRLRAPLDDARMRHDAAALEAGWQQCINRFSNMTVRQMLTQECDFSAEEIKEFANVGLGTGGLASYLENDVSALELAREITADLTKGQGLLPNGTRNAVQRLGARSVRRADNTEGSLDDIAERRLGATVTKVSLENGKPVIHAVDESGVAQRQAYDFVVVTPHAGAAKRINLEEVLDETTLQAIEQCDMMGSSKLIAETDVFWKNSDGSVKEGMAVAFQSDDERMNSAYLVAYPGKDGEGEKGVAYIDYRWKANKGRKRNKVLGALGVIKKMSPLLNDNLSVGFSEVFAIDWDTYHGAFRELSAKHASLHDPLARALSPETFHKAKAPVIFANADSILGGYSDTAAIEAYRAARLVVQHFGGEIHPDMPSFTYFNYDTKVRHDSQNSFTA